MTYASQDLHTLHDCQDVLERALRAARVEIQGKLEGLHTEDGKALFAEFDQALTDYTSDCMSDTLDAWAISKKSDCDDVAPYERPMVPLQAAE